MKKPNLSNKNSFLSLTETSKLYGVPRAYLNVLIRRGKLKAVKRGKQWLTTAAWLFEYQGTAATQKPPDDKYLSLESAARIVNTTPGYLKVAVHRGKLRAVKLGRGWFTTSEWLEAYKPGAGTRTQAPAKSGIPVSKEISREFDRRREFNFKALVATALVVVFLTFFLSLAVSEIGSKKYSARSGMAGEEFSAAAFSEVFENFPSDLPLFFKWLAQGPKNFLAIFKPRPFLTFAPLPSVPSKIIKTQEFSKVDTLAEAEALDALSGLAAARPGESGREGLPVSGVAGLDNRLLVIEAELKEQKELIKAGLIFQNDFFSAFKALSDFVPKHPPSTIVVQGSPATLTTFSVQPSVHTGFDRLSASYLTLSNDATINGKLTVKSGGDFNSLSVSGGTSLSTLTVSGAASFSNVIASNLIPKTDLTYNLGSDSLRWNNLYLNNVFASALNASSTSYFSGQLVISQAPFQAHTFGSWAPDTAGSNVSNSSLYINATSSVTDSNLLGLAVNGNVKFLVDAEGDVFAKSVTASGGTTLSTTTVSTLTVENNATLGDAASDTLTVNARIASDLIPTADLTYRLGTSTLRWLSLDVGKITVGTGTISLLSGNIISGAGQFNIVNSANTALTFSTDNSERMRIDSSGNVGIGTTTADKKLTVWGDGRFFGSLAASSTAYFDGLVNANSGLTVVGATSLQNATATNGFAVSGSSFTVGGQNFVVQTSGAASTTQLTVSGTSNLGGLITSQSGISVTGGNLNLNNLGITNAGSIAGGTTAVFSTSVQTPLIFNSGTLTASTTGANPLIFATNSSERMRIDSSGNVGIGTAVPNARLTVGALGQASRIQIDSNVNNPTIGFGNGEYTGTVPLYNSFIETIITGAAASTKMNFTVAGAGNASTTVLTLQGDGNVGIGTAGPASILHISAASTNTTAPTGTYGQSVIIENISATTNNYSSIIFRGSGSDMSMISNINTVHGASPTSDLAFFTRNAGSAPERMRILSSGNIGIGTTTPGSLLHLGAAGSKLTISRTNSVDDFISLIQYGSGGDTFNIMSETDATFRIKNPTFGTLLTIKNSGNVGIGTTTPAAKLDVAGGINYTGNILKTGTADLDFQIQGPIMTFDADSNNDQTGEAFRFTIHNGSTEWMRIANGNVGIGTTTPTSARLVIQGSTTDSTAAGLNVTDSSGISKLYVRNDGNVGIGAASTVNSALNIDRPIGTSIDMAFQHNGVLGALIGVAGTAGTMASEAAAEDTVLRANSGALLFTTGGASTRMYISNTGNVGIGTTSPDHFLNVRGAGSELLKVEGTGADSNPHIAIVNDARQFNLQVVGARGDNFEIQDATAGSGASTVRLAITTTGNVGIGTTTPTALLELTHASLPKILLSGQGTSRAFLENNLSTGLTTLSSVGDPLRFVASSEAMRIITSGNVGIGTTTPGARLHVEGAAGSIFRLSRAALFLRHSTLISTI
ncbi:MAG: hypothetical protein HYT13_01010 [Candidatus Liptonbacteria bacterium]|nr:hypothetical protein [Candidatus Liptonbacteria bacterium]